MATPCEAYSFKREAKVYILEVIAGVEQSDQYFMDVSEINFGQTFQDYGYSSKTLQQEYMFSQSVVNKANPATFDFTFPTLQETDMRLVFDKALDYGTFNIYVETEQNIYKIEGCIITNMAFHIERARPLSLGITGEGRKVSIESSIPGNPVVRSNTRTYNRISDLDITLGGTFKISNLLASVSLELQNDIQWIPYTTVNDAIAVEAQGVAKTMYPNSYTVSKRILAGTFTKYITDENIADVFQWNSNASLLIAAGQISGGTFYGFNIDIANCTYTNRLDTGEVFTQSFDWRMTQNTDITQIITYIPIPPSDIFTDDFGPEFY